MTPEQLEQLLTEGFGEHMQNAEVSFDQLTATLDGEGYVQAARFCRDDPRLDCNFFDCLFAVDERDDGFAIIANLYSTSHRHRVLLRHLCSGGREAPEAPSLTSLYRGANWHEREAWDMFGIEFEGHPGLGPRLLCPENFEGWPLRKDFPLATREAKPWPGAKEPVERGTEEQREDALVSTVASAGIRGDEEPGAREEVATKAERARQKATELRRKRAQERAEARERGEEAVVERAPGEETQAERAERAARESQEAHAERDLGVYDQTSVPGEHTAGAGDAGGLGGAYYGGPPAPPSPPSAPDLQGTTPLHQEAGKVWPIADQEPRPPGNVSGQPPATQSPGEAPVEGGISERIDEEADEQGLRQGDRPASTAPPAAEPPPLVTEDAPTVLDLGTGSDEADTLGPSGPQQARTTTRPEDEE